MSKHTSSSLHVAVQMTVTYGIVIIILKILKIIVWRHLRSSQQFGASIKGLYELYSLPSRVAELSVRKRNKKKDKNMGGGERKCSTWSTLPHITCHTRFLTLFHTIERHAILYTVFHGWRYLFMVFCNILT